MTTDLEEKDPWTKLFEGFNDTSIQYCIEILKAEMDKDEENLMNQIKNASLTHCIEILKKKLKNPTDSLPYYSCLN